MLKRRLLESVGNLEWWQSLLPIHALSFRMRFTQSSNPGFFHQAALTGWLRTILGSPEDYGKYMTLDALEQGHHRFTAGEEYRFTVFGIGDRGREYLAQLPEAISASRAGRDDAMAFRDNWRLETVEHWSSGEKIFSNNIPLALDAHLLAEEVAFWKRQRRIRLRFFSPWRVLRSKERRKRAKGELRYCRDVEDLREQTLWLTRVDDALRKLAEDHGLSMPQRPVLPPVAAGIDLFWVNASYRNKQGNTQPMGGLLGEINIHDPAAFQRDAGTAGDRAVSRRWSAARLRQWALPAGRQ